MSRLALANRSSPKRRRATNGQGFPRYKNYLDFLMSLPFESVFGWSKLYRSGLCSTIVNGDRGKIQEFLQTAVVQHVGPLSVTDEGADVGANALVFTRARFQTQDVAVKMFNTDTSQSSDDVQLRAMYEAVMGVIVHALLQHTSVNIQTPKIYGYGHATLSLQNPDMDYVDSNGVTNVPVLVMSPLQGQRMSRLSEKKLKQALYQTAVCLKELQKRFSFSHRDLHTGNIRFDPLTESIEIFDFGESCFSWDQSTTAAFQFPITEMYDSTCDDCSVVHTCSNRSFDMTVLVASCLLNCPNLSEDGFLYNLALEILSFYQQFDNEIMDFSNFHKQYNHEMAKCIPKAFIGIIDNLNLKNQAKLNNPAKNLKQPLKF
jgi:hypothetical protein